MESYFGEHAFEDLMQRAEPAANGRIYLADVAARLHISEADLGYFAYCHLGDEDYNPDSGTLSEDGADALYTFLSREGTDEY